LEPLRHVANKEFGAVIFRRTSPQITNEGGLWDEAGKVYPLVGGEPRQGDLEWRFPSGACVSFRHLQYESTKYNWQGSQICLLAFDELTHFTEGQFFYLLSRNRSTCGVRPYVRATCNPDAASWVAEFISWWIDPETGLADLAKSGVIRWFIRHEGELIWADSEEELRRQYADSKPKSVTFIPASLEDNPTGLAKNPDYRANLMALSRVDRARLLDGNWHASSTDGAEWPGEYFPREIWPDYWPTHWDAKAIAVDPSKGRNSKKGDYSAIVFAGLSGGLIWVDADLDRRPPTKIVADTLTMQMEYHAHAIGVEEDQLEELLLPVFEQQVLAMQAQGIVMPPAPLIFIRQGGVKKELRISRLGPYWARGKLRFRDTPGCRLLIQQCRQFPHGEFDDAPDALEMVVRMLVEQVGGGELMQEVAVA
jgi:predicted phage terminase large subunit-like protein